MRARAQAAPENSYTIELGQDPAFDAWRGAEVLPGPDVTGATDLREFVRRAASIYHHPVGTCEMGADHLSVVDHELRVRGIERLRVADASIMPRSCPPTPTPP